MNLIHFDIQREIDDLSRVVDERAALEKKPKCGEDEKRNAEQMVCVQSRSLFSRYVDAALWSGIDEPTTTSVRAALRRSLASLKADKACIGSVEERIADFEAFVIKQSKIVHS